MRILLLNMYFPPDTSATAKMAASVVQALSTAHDATIVCGRPSYDPTERRSWLLWQTEQMGRVRIIRVGSSAYPRFQMRRRLLNYLSYAALSVVRALFVPCDVVVAMTDPPFAGILGAIVALMKGKPYVYNIRDLYPDMAVGGAIVQAGLLVRVWEKLHRWALRRAACVVVLGDDMRARIAAKGVEVSRVIVVRDGTDTLPTGGPGAAIDPEVVRTIREDFSFVLVHAGNLGFYGAWDTLVTAARKLESEGVGLVFIGEGAQRAQVEAAAAGAGNIRFLPFFPASKISSVLDAGDAHVITIKRGLEGVVVPSKMYGILSAGKAIVAVAPKETDVVTLGERRGFAVSADPDNPKEVTSVIRGIASDASRLKAMGEAARAAAPDYDRVTELRKYLQIISRTVAAEKIEEAQQA